MAFTPASSRGAGAQNVAPVTDSVMAGVGGAWAASKVTQAMIDASAVTNAKVAPGAAIAASKLNLATAQAAELAYVERTTDLSVTATSEGTAQEIVSAGAVAFDGATKARIEFFAVRVQTGSGIAGPTIVIGLWDDATVLGWWAVVQPDSSGPMDTPVQLARYLTPTNASHTYIAKAWRANANGTIFAGSGGTGAYLPAYIRVSVA